MRTLFLSTVTLSFVLFHVPIRAAECVSSSRAVVAAEYRQILEREPDAAGVRFNVDSGAAFIVGLPVSGTFSPRSSG
jgi:hypothetical protein